MDISNNNSTFVDPKKELFDIKLYKFLSFEG